MIYIKAASEPYDEEIVDYITLIQKKQNLVDASTESSLSTELLDVIWKLKIQYDVERWITRTKVTSNKEEENTECENNSEGVIKNQYHAITMTYDCSP